MKCFLISLFIISTSLNAMTIEAVKHSSDIIDTAGFNVDVCDFDKYQSLSTKLTKKIKSLTDLNKVDSVISNGVGKIEDAIKCVGKVYQYRLEKYPAIIINHKYVTYGETDIARAVVECKRRGLCNEK